MTDDELAAFGEQLRALHDSLAETLLATEARSKPVSLDDPIGRLSRVDALQQQHMADAQARHAREQLAAVRLALKRIELGTYGDCFDCGEPIDPRRLRARPAVTLCLACQQARGG